MLVNFLLPICILPALQLQPLLAFNGAMCLLVLPLLFFGIIGRELFKFRDVLKLSWHIVEITESDSELVDEWCRENNISKYKLVYETKCRKFAYAIKNDNELFAFKLRWL